MLRPRISSLWTDAPVRDLLRLAADAPRRARHEPPFPRLRRGDRLRHLCRGPVRSERLSRRAAADFARGFAQRRLGSSRNRLDAAPEATACSLVERRGRTRETE